MNFLQGIVRVLLNLITLRSWRARRARARYDFLKAEICKRHFEGYKGLIVDFPGRRFSIQDLACFKSPMYFMIRNADKKWCIFWDHKRMSQEIGTGKPLKDGEPFQQEIVGKFNPKNTPDKVDEKVDQAGVNGRAEEV